MKTVLIVEDSKSMRQLVAYTMREGGFEVIESGDGDEALMSVAEKRVDLVITDLNMPGMDGIELIRELRRHPLNKFTPIIVLTTDNLEQRRRKAKDAGATGWIVKPFHPEKLLRAVAKVVP